VNNRPVVLIVDDDASMRAMMTLSLKRAGYPTLSAANGPDALLMLASRPISCMLTDGRMDPMDGFELARRAKILRPDLRIAMASAVYTAADAGSSPIDRLFEKPVAVSALVAWLQER
jgi:two-component system KDP operon response regulator KdpE